MVGIPTLFQLTVAHGLLDHLERDPMAIGSGQLWRLVTSLVVQDGGWSDALVNLAFLVVAGTAAERAWGTRCWLVLAVAAGVGAQLWGLLVQPVGAGNSVVNFGLAASLAVLAARHRADSPRLLAIISLLVAVVLLAAGNIRGRATVIGATVGAVLARGSPDRSTSG